MTSQIDDDRLHRLQLRIEGAVQGIGFRPFVYRLARTLGVTGSIRNTGRGVVIDLEGTDSQLDEFQIRLRQDKPALAKLQKIEVITVEAIGYREFEILASEEETNCQSASALIMPDLATCSACLADIFNPSSRHYRYPFTNCTYCGSRFSIVRSLPYDRARTTLQEFSMCPVCQAEYDDPDDRRFHAQPNACPHCGPHLELWDRCGRIIADRDRALRLAAAAVRSGQILALKGLGGFHTIVDARNDAAVKTLRDRKHRPDKPFAVMFPSLDRVREYCRFSPLEAQILQSAAAPIVLLPIQKTSSTANLSPAISPNNPYLGVLLPYTPLHHLLLADLGFPIVATSGNRSGEPICIDETQAIETLAGIADLFLVHNRPIARPIDDSIVRVVNGETTLLRRTRGYAPLPIPISKGLEAPRDVAILALGGHLKNTIALYVRQQLLVSQYLGDLDTVRARDRFREAVRHLCSLYNTKPTIVACDAHPDYYSTQFALEISSSITKDAPKPQLLPVQHHYAHVLACLADNQWQPPALGIAWDGTGYGWDGTIWGGEFLWIPTTEFSEPEFIRAAHLRSFPLLGGDRAAREPRRCALGLLYECLGDAAFEEVNLASIESFSTSELAILKKMLQKDSNSPRTSSMGRLFDAIASLVGLCQQNSFEGQAAMQLEYAIAGLKSDAIYPYRVVEEIDRPLQPLQLDYAPMLKAILQEIEDRVSSAVMAVTFHNTLVAGLVDIACRLRNRYPELDRVVLTGGCFQNRYLLERSINRLQQHDFLVGSHHQLPSNDGAISVGQAIAALRFLKGKKEV